MRTRCFSSFTLATCFVCGITSLGHAHDLIGLIVESSSISSETAEKFQEIDRSRIMLSGAASGNREDVGLEGVVREALRWPNDVISVCFFGGNKDAREQISQIASDWTKETRIGFDFGAQGRRRTCDPQNPSDIRVSFDGAGYWSYVGIKAKFINPFKQTLNLSGMGSGRALSSTEKGTVLHEFGHAIGFEHEHQSPIGGCDNEFNWQYLYTALGWDRAKVDFNMKQLSQSSRRDGLLYVTPFDRDSVMLYSLPAQAFIDPDHSSCFISRRNNDLSETDTNTAKSMYPIRIEMNEDAPSMFPGANASSTNPQIQGTITQLKELTNP